MVHFKDTLVLADAVVGRHRYLPLGGLLTDVADNYWLLSLELYWNESKVKLVWEVEHGAATTGADRDDELLALCHDHEVVGVVALGLGREFYDVSDVHAWGNLGRHLVDFGCGGAGL